MTFGDIGLPVRLEGELLDLRFRLFPRPPPATPVVIVAIDDTSIASIGRWPWSRDIFAKVLDRLADAGAKVIGFDLLFTEPQPSPLASAWSAIEPALAPVLSQRDPSQWQQLSAMMKEQEAAQDGDAAFARAIARDGRVIVPFALDLHPGGASPGALPAPPTWLAKAELNRIRGAGNDNLPLATALRLPIAALAQDALLAHVTIVPDAGGAHRYLYPVLRYADAYYPALSLEAVRAFLGVSRFNTVVDLGHGIDIGRLHVPTDEALRLLVKYYAPDTFATVSFADVWHGRTPRGEFDGKIVLIGATAVGVGDSVVTPYLPSMPGVEWHATLIANMLGHDFLRRGAGARVFDMLLIVCSSLAIGLAALRGVGLAALAAAASLAGVAAIDSVAFVRFGLWLNAAFPTIAILLTVTVVAGDGYAAARRQEGRIRAAFSRYLHADVVAELCRTPAALRLGGEERELTVLFADVRDFSTFAEGLSAPELVHLMNEFFTAMTDVVLAHRGMLDKYIGDGLMAVFGAPLPDAEQAQHACQAALGMHATLVSLQQQWRTQGRPCLAVRIGINTGRMVIGNMGTDQHFDYTVMGDEVNVAARLEAANKQIGSTILISASTAQALGGRVTLRARGSITVKGRLRPIEVFELPVPDQGSEGSQAGALGERPDLEPCRASTEHRAS